MPNEGDVALAKLAIEAGYLPREVASQYWRQIQAPGGPRLVELLLRDGRLTPPQVDHLRTLYFQRQGGGPATGTLPAPPDPRKTMLPSGDASESQFLTAEEAWEEALELDTELARILLSKRLVSQPQLRECREIQLAQHMRLGDVLSQRGYLDQATISGILEMVQDAPMVRGSAEPETRPRPAAPLPKPRIPAPPLSPSGQLYVSPRPQPPLPPARPREMPAEAMRLTQELTPEEIVAGNAGFGPAGQSLFERGPSPPPLPSSGRLQVGPEEVSPPPLMDQDEAPTVVGAKAVRRRPPDDQTMANLDLSVDELNPFAGFGGPGGARERSDDSLDIIMEPSFPRGGGPAPGDLLADRSKATTQTDDRPPPADFHLPMHSVDELDAFSDMFNRVDALGDSQAVTVEKDMRDEVSAEAQGAWASGSEAWGPGPGFDESDGGPSTDGGGGDPFGGAFDSEETGGAGYINFNNLPNREKLINSEDVPPRAPVGAPAFAPKADPFEGSEHPPAPRPAPVVSAKPPRKGGVLGKLIKGLLVLVVLAGVGVGAYFGFSYLFAQQAGSGAPQEPPPAEPPSGE